MPSWSAAWRVGAGRRAPVRPSAGAGARMAGVEVGDPPGSRSARPRVAARGERGAMSIGDGFQLVSGPAQSQLIAGRGALLDIGDDVSVDSAPPLYARWVRSQSAPTFGWEPDASSSTRVRPTNHHRSRRDPRGRRGPPGRGGHRRRRAHPPWQRHFEGSGRGRLRR